MAVQIFLQGKLLGIQEFLLSLASSNADHDQVFTGRSQWAALLSEVLPRALLAKLGLSKVLLGTSGGGQFLLVLPDEFRDAAWKFLEAAAQDVTARGMFTSVPDLARKLRRYINAYSANAQPIRWKYADVTRRIRSNDLAATVH